MLNLEDALTNILEDVATNYFRSLYEVRDFATDAFQKATREFVFDIEDIPYRNYTKFLDEQLHSYFEEEVKEKQFLTYAHAGSKMDPLHAMTILANMYARACGISLGDRTIAYDAAYAWLRRYNEEHPEENRWNKTDMFSEVIPYLIDDYESKRIEDYDISFWETEDEIKYAVEIIDMYDSDTMKALCWGLSMKEQRKFLFQLEKVIVHEDNHVDTTERGIFFDQVEAEKAMLDWTLNNRGQLLCYIIRTVPRCEAFNEGLVKAIKASEHFIDDLRLKEFVYLPAGFKRKQHFNVGDDVKYIFYDGVNTVLHTSRIVQLPARSGEGILMSDGYQVPERYVFTNNV